MKNTFSTLPENLTQVWRLLFILFIVLFSPSVMAQTSDAECESEVSFEQPALEAYVDRTAVEAIKKYDVVGMGISVIHCGEIVHLSGHGLADIDTQTAVDPDYHLFRIGSVTKTMTFTGLMQLVEAGQVQLDANVNDYLVDVQIPDSGFGPIKIKDIFTHRPGFEDGAAGYLFERDPNEQTDLKNFLLNHMPKRVRPAGEVTSYSNYSVAIAGLIIENISGQSYADYIQEHIFSPLKMTSTTALEPGSFIDGGMETTLIPRLASVYKVKADGSQKQPFELIGQAGPAGSVSSTPSDMARFMIGLLRHDPSEGATMMSKESFNRFRSRPYKNREGARDLAHGLFNGSIAGEETLHHGGATLTSFSSMMLVPDQSLGIFVTVNGASSDRVSGELSEKILADFFLENKTPEAPTLTNIDLSPYTGNYLTTRRSYSKLEKIYHPFTGSAKVTMGDNNRLVISESKNDNGVYVPLSKNHFRNIATDSIIYFEEVEDSNKFRFYASAGHYAYERVKFSSSIILLFSALGFGTLIAIARLIAILIGRKTTHKRVSVKSIVNILSPALVIATALAFVLSLVQMAQLGTEIVYIWPTSLLRVLTIIIVASVPIWLFHIGQTIYELRSDAAMGQKSIKLLHAVTLVILIVFLYWWNMVGFKY